LEDFGPRAEITCCIFASSVDVLFSFNKLPPAERPWLFSLQKRLIFLVTKHKCRITWRHIPEDP